MGIPKSSATGAAITDISLASDFTQTSSTLTNLTGFAIPVVASGKYKGLLTLGLTGSTGGLRIGFTFPTACILKIALVGSTSATTTQVETWLNVSSSPGSGSEIAITLGSASIASAAFIMISIANGANAGNVQVQVKSFTNTQSNVLTADLTSLEYRRTA